MKYNFRFSSTWERFVKAVSILKELLAADKAYCTVGFLNEFSFYMDDDVDLEKDIDMIINSEIVYLLRWYLDYNYNSNKEELEEERIRSAIRAVHEAQTDENLEQMVKNVQNKLELVKDAFDIDRLAARYKVKQDAVNLKLFEFNYNVYAQNLPGRGNINFALVNMVCKKKLRSSMQGAERLFVEHEKGESVTFVCDEEDIDLWIAHLEEMRQRIKGELQ